MAVVFVLLTRPDLVFLRTVGTSWTAGAGAAVLGAALGFAALLVAVLAFGFAAAVFGLGAAFALVVLVAAFLGAAFFATLGLVSVFSFCSECQSGFNGRQQAQRTFGAAAFFSAAGLASFFAILTGPEGPEKSVLAQMVTWDWLTLWLGEVALVDSSLQSLVE